GDRRAARPHARRAPPRRTRPGRRDARRLRADRADGLGHEHDQPGDGEHRGVHVEPVRDPAMLAGSGLLLRMAEAIGRASASGALVYSFMLLVAWSTIAGVGGYLRFQQERRKEAVRSVRRAERLELARELHDLVAHHITGIVVQAQAARTVAQ